jgi:hypothetical protein
MRDHILQYTDDSDKETRQAAVVACAKVRGGGGEKILIRLSFQLQGF